MEAFTVLLIFLPGVISQSPSWWTNMTNPGEICHSDDDKLGVHLGCSCVDLLPQDSMKKADCSNKWIGYNDSLAPPPYLNISDHVRILDLSSNYLTELTPETFGVCVSVQILSVSNNNIQRFTGVNCPQLMKLDLSRNRLTNLSRNAIELTPRLVELDLSFNEILFIDDGFFQGLKSLRVLKLGSNKLGMEVFYVEEYVLSLSHLESLEELDLSNSSLPDFPLYLINGTRRLKTLNLRDNLISSVDNGVFHEIGELKELDLSGNLFDELLANQFVGLRHLEILKLDKMKKLKTIHDYAFSGLRHLHELSCQMNYYLTSISSQAFRSDPELNISSPEPKIVRLGDNSLTYFDYPLLNWAELDILELHRNNWVCDCELQWVSDFFRHKPKEAKILEESYFNCYEPHIFAGVPVVAVNPEEMLCFSPAATIAGTIGIAVFGVVLFSFCFVIILNQMGMLPDWVRQYNLFGSGSNLPTYTRVHPRPTTKARRMMGPTSGLEPEVHCYSATTRENLGGLGSGGSILPKLALRGTAPTGSTEPIMDEMEWDNSDITK